MYSESNKLLLPEKIPTNDDNKQDTERDYEIPFPKKALNDDLNCH